MKLTFYVADTARMDTINKLFFAMAKGCSFTGDSCDMVSALPQTHVEDSDMAVIIGVRADTRAIAHSYLSSGKHVLFIDKGYVRSRDSSENSVFGLKHVKVSVDALHPTKYLMRERHSADRWEMIQHLNGLPDWPGWEGGGEDILVLGMSQEFADFIELGDAFTCSKRIVLDAATKTTRTIVYRPKPSRYRTDCVPGFRCSVGPKDFVKELNHSKVVVSYASGGGINAVLAGVPVIELGRGCAEPVALGISLDVLQKEPWELPAKELVMQWCNNLAYSLWSLTEIAQGKMWQYVREKVLLC